MYLLFSFKHRLRYSRERAVQSLLLSPAYQPPRPGRKYRSDDFLRGLEASPEAVGQLLPGVEDVALKLFARFEAVDEPVPHSLALDGTDVHLRLHKCSFALLANLRLEPG